MNPPSLKYFFVFNPTLSTKEGTEHENILFFYPPTVNIDEQTRNVGLSQALAHFTSTFSPDRLCESVRREKHTCAYFNPEKDIWLAMIVRNPFISRTAKDGKVSHQYFEDDLDDALLQTIVRQAYKMFKLFNGPIRLLTETEGVDTVRTRLQSFLPYYLLSLNFEQLDLFNTLEGIQFLPVDKNVYLRIQSFINLTEDHFPKLQYAAFLYRDHLVWSGLEQDDMRTVYSYIVSQMASADLNGRESGVPPKIKGRTGFVTGPEDLTNTSLLVTAPRVFVGNNQQYRLIVYELQDILSLFLVEQSALQDYSLYQQLDAYIAPHITFLAPILSEHYIRKHGSEDQYRYVYFNHMNLAIKTSLKQKGGDLPRDTTKMLNEIHADFERQPSLPSEVLIRTSSDRWLVGRKSDQREFYVFFDSKTANLLEINEEVRKLGGTYFNNIFID